MKKIPTLYLRDAEQPQRLLRMAHPECLWVLQGEGMPTQKWNGTCCLVRDGKLFKRREIQRFGVIPAGFEEEEHDLMTGKLSGWVPVEPVDRWHHEAWQALKVKADGTYELLGPRVQGNPERLSTHTLLRHGSRVIKHVPTSFDDLAQWLRGKDIEGVVWHHEDGRMAKIKLRDFGFKRGEK